ncbi:hypothetical protein A2W14_06925 [Candidatus Gottesmanbacteria bacterium RBG_16_37_8]|uniref:Uncharacterized protein n=1 Tax=Candidatus Gottesmanbacteria bacterium RBG_16_37_8 TaxID=1798371 RepID=A0A1F5YT64_9BACT|nr:MAG: hypothetical protein A2W14_06925 [Candidatus Gottesmanbacteria bacterium RBG_16_37_8]
MLESHGLTVDSFIRKGDRAKLIILPLTSVEEQMEITRSGLRKFIRILQEEKRKIINDRMLQVPLVIKEATELFRRREGGKEKDKSKKD